MTEHVCAHCRRDFSLKFTTAQLRKIWFRRPKFCSSHCHNNYRRGKSTIELLGEKHAAELKKRHSQLMSLRWSDPSFRRKMVAAISHSSRWRGHVRQKFSCANCGLKHFPSCRRKGTYRHFCSPQCHIAFRQGKPYETYFSAEKASELRIKHRLQWVGNTPTRLAVRKGVLTEDGRARLIAANKLVDSEKRRRGAMARWSNPNATLTSSRRYDDGLGNRLVSKPELDADRSYILITYNSRVDNIPLDCANEIIALESIQAYMNKHGQEFLLEQCHKLMKDY